MWARLLKLETARSLHPPFPPNLWWTTRGERRDQSEHLPAAHMPKGRASSRGHSSPYSRSGSSGVYTSSGARVNNPAAYAATGARTYTSSGKSVANPVAYAGAIEASVRQNTSTPKYLYHYTDSSSLHKISDSGRIKSSTGPGDCALGEGVCAHGMPRTLQPKRWQSDSKAWNHESHPTCGRHDCQASSLVRLGTPPQQLRRRGLIGGKLEGPELRSGRCGQSECRERPRLSWARRLRCAWRRQPRRVLRQARPPLMIRSSCPLKLCLCRGPVRRRAPVACAVSAKSLQGAHHDSMCAAELVYCLHRLCLCVRVVLYRINGPLDRSPCDSILSPKSLYTISLQRIYISI